MNELKNIWILTKSGFLPKEKRNLKETIYLGLKLYGILILMKGFCFGISYFLDFYDIFKIPAHIGGEKIRSYSSFQRILIIAIIAPIIEEFAYRIGIIFSKQNLTITAIGISYFILLSLTKFQKLYCASIALSLGTILYFSLKKNIVKLLSEFWKENKRKVFYGLLLIFSFLHLGNYEITIELLIFSPIVILRHFLAGFIYSYARLNSGIILAICLHSLNNSLLFIILLIFR